MCLRPLSPKYPLQNSGNRIKRDVVIAFFLYNPTLVVAIRDKAMQRLALILFLTWIVSPAIAEIPTIATTKDRSFFFPLLLQELQQQGLIEGRDFRVISIDLSTTETNRAALKQRIESEVDLFFVGGSQLNTLVGSIQPRTPVLFIGVKGVHPIPTQMKPYTTGLYRSLSIAKVMEQMRRILPDSKRLALLYREHSGLQKLAGRLQRRAKKADVRLVPAAYETADDFDALFARLRNEVDGVVLFLSSVFPEDLPSLVAAQFKYGVPVLAQMGQHIEAGALGGPALNNRYAITKLGDYAARIINGEQISRLPIVFDNMRLRINLATASRLGLELPRDIVSQADIVGISSDPGPTTPTAAELKPGQYSVAIPHGVVPSFYQGILQALALKGYRQGDNLTVHRFFCDDKAPAADLVFAQGTIITRLLDKNTDTTIVAASIFYDALKTRIQNKPVHVVFRSSSARVATLITQIFPDKTVGALIHADSTLKESENYSVMAQSLKKLGLNLVEQRYKDPSELGSIMATWKQQGVAAVMLFTPSLASPADLDEVVKQQFALNLPVISLNELDIPKGVALGVSVNSAEIYRQMARMSDEVLQRSEVTAPKTVYLKSTYLINLDSVQKLQLDIPRSVISDSDIIQ